MITNVTAYKPAFGTSISKRVKNVVTDPDEVTNKEALAAGATGTIGAGAGAAAIKYGSDVNKIKKAAQPINGFMAKTKLLKGKNTSLVKRFFDNISKTLKSSKLTSWISKLMGSAVGKKAIFFVAGAGALFITATQLFSMGEMAFKGIHYYSSSSSSDEKWDDENF